MAVKSLISATLAVLLSLVGSRLALAQPMHQSLDQRQSSTAIMSPQNRALQQDPMLNPASLWVIEGEALWRQPMGQQACSSCHGDAEITMKGIAARFPRYSSGKLMNLEMRINTCRTLHQKQSAFAFESAPLLSLATYIGKQSAGHPIQSESTPLNQADLSLAPSSSISELDRLMSRAPSATMRVGAKSSPGSPFRRPTPRDIQFTGLSGSLSVLYSVGFATA